MRGGAWARGGARCEGRGEGGCALRSRVICSMLLTMLTKTGVMTNTMKTVIRAMYATKSTKNLWL